MAIFTRINGQRIEAEQELAEAVAMSLCKVAMYADDETMVGDERVLVEDWYDEAGAYKDDDHDGESAKEFAARMFAEARAALA